jgi:glycyl-tRNA synthetase alpha chain
MFTQQKKNIYDLLWNNEGVKYGDIFLQNEYEHSKYNFEIADCSMLFNLFNVYENEFLNLIKEELVLPAYDYVMKCSHTFNLLDARSAISVTERQGYIMRVRDMSRKVATLYLKKREEMGFPLLKTRKNGESNG